MDWSGNIVSGFVSGFEQCIKYSFFDRLSQTIQVLESLKVVTTFSYSRHQILTFPSPYPHIPVQPSL